MRAHLAACAGLRFVAPWRLRLILSVLLGMAFGSCAKSNTVVFVTVEDAEGTLDNIVQLKVTVSIGGAVSRFFAPAVPDSKIAFPTTFSVELDPSRTGALAVDVSAVNPSGVTVAQNAAHVPEIGVGSRNNVTVRLSRGPGDGGVDSADGAAETDGSRDAGPGDLGPADGGHSDLPLDLAADAHTDVVGSGGMTGSAGASGAGGATGSGGASGVGGDTGTGGDPGTGGAGGDGDPDAGDDADPDAPVD